MRTSDRLSTTVLTILAAAALGVGACAPTVGPLGTPSTPAPTGNASVAAPSGDATPGPTSAPSTTPVPSATVPPSTSPDASAESSASPAGTPTPTPTAVPAATATPSQVTTTIVRCYFVLGSFTGNAGLAPVLRVIPATTGVAAASIRQLIAGPNAAELSARPAMSSAVPSATRLLGLSIANGVATVNLSSEFRTGSDRNVPLAQVVYTLTQFSTVTSVRFQVEGQPLDQAPGTRADYRDGILPAIFVDHPAWGAAAGNPAKIAGEANVFEATFHAQLRDGNGGVLVDQQVHASCGTGCWGDFAATLPYAVSNAQWGTLRVYDLSAKDGSPESVTDYPVWLTPAN